MKPKMKRIKLLDIMYPIIVENSGWLPLVSAGKIRFLLSVDDGTSKEILTATIGVRVKFKLVKTKIVEKMAFPSVSAARMLREEIENFLKNRFGRVFKSDLYNIEGFSMRHPDKGHTFPSGHAYDSSASAGTFKFGKSHIVDIFDPVIMKSPVSDKDVFDSLKKNIAARLLSDKLFKSDKSKPWELV